MKVWEIRGDWSMDHLQPGERPKPAPGPGQVLLSMRAASLNFRDLVVPKRGYGALTGTLPLIPVSDGVGIVAAVGEGVRRVGVGDRVCPLFMPYFHGGEPSTERLTRTLGGPIDGVMAEWMVLDEGGVSRVPGHLTDEQAATLPCAALTAWTALITSGAVRAGDRVLVQGTGGVSLFALQFARMAGAYVIVTSSSDEKLEKAKAMGANAVVNYRRVPEWGKAVREMAGGEGVDHIVEVGGEQTLNQSLRAIRIGGTISLIGVLSGGNLDVKLGPIVTRHVRLQGITVGHRDGFEAMARAIGQHHLVPVVDRVFDFGELREALAHLASGRHFGKICLRHPAR